MEFATRQPVSLLSYRPWRGRLGGPWRGSLAVARLGLAGLLRRKLFWALFAFAGLIFFSFFFGQYLLVWAGSQVGEDSVRAGGFVRLKPAEIVKQLRDSLKLNGSAETFRNLFWYQGMILTVSLALAGAQLVGNDFRHRSLPFYLSKPLTTWHYVAGKCLAVSAVILLMTALPAFCLYVEFGLLDSWQYFLDKRSLLLGIAGYGAILCIVLSLLLVAVTSVVQKTVPLVMVWSALFVFAPVVGQTLATWTEQPNWRLIEIWNSAYVVGNHMLGLSLEHQPSVFASALTLVFACAISLICLHRRIRAVEIV